MTTVLKRLDETPKCTGVSWGHFTVKKSLAEDLGTSSLGSCFAFITLNANTDQVFFAHVSNDSETKWLIENLTKPPGFVERMKTNWNVKYYAFTGKDPNQKTTLQRIKKIDQHLGGNLVKEESATTGAVILSHSKWKTKPTFLVVKDIDAINADNYKSHTKVGMEQEGGALLAMPESDSKEPAI